MDAKSLLQGFSLAPSYPLPKLSKTTMTTTNYVRFNFNHNPCLIFANGYPTSSSFLPFSSIHNKPRKSSPLIVSARKKDKKDDTHSSVPQPDEVTGFFPEAVLLKKVTFLPNPPFAFLFPSQFNMIFAVAAIFHQIGF